MKRPLIKICGLTREEDVDLCCRLGVDFCGFVTEYPIPVPWNLTRERCARLIGRVCAPARSCVVTGGDPERVCRLVRALRPDFVQLHYRESLEETERIVRALRPLGTGVVKTLPVSEAERLEQFGEREAELCAEKLCAAGVAAILVDSRTPANAGSAGTAVDLAFFQRVRRGSASRPVILAGGITPENCGEALRAAPEIVDVMTGVETAPGVKSEEKLLRLLEGLRNGTAP